MMEYKVQKYNFKYVLNQIKSTDPNRFAANYTQEFNRCKGTIIEEMLDCILSLVYSKFPTLLAFIQHKTQMFIENVME